MKKEELIAYIEEPGRMTEQSVQDLLELSRKYPFFASPLVVLSKYLKEQHSDRYEDILYKTALRVPDREWLHSLLHSGLAMPGNVSLTSGASEMQETVVEPETETRDTFGDSPEAEIIEDIESVEEIETPEEIEAMEEIEELLAEVEFKNEEPTEEIAVEETQPEESVEEIEEILDVYPEPELDTYGSDETEDTGPDEPEESVAEDAGSEDTEEATVELDALEELLNETNVHAPETILEQPADVIAEDEQVFEEISDFSSQHGGHTYNNPPGGAHFAPAAHHEMADEEIPALDPEQEASLMESLDEIEGLLQKGGVVDLQPDLDQRPRPRLINQAAVYDIENYFPVSADANTAPTDFYSWLSNPGFLGKPAEDPERDEEKKFRHEELLNRFIETNPSISRPQKDFFNPVDAAKRSEKMPLELATETLAHVYLGQANYQGAIKIYEQLMRKMPEKKPYFAAQIKKIKKENNI